ncbi:MAG: NnrU family protein [Asticcacaulis sp.]
MWTLALACAFFLCIHLMISGTVLKDQIISGIGGLAYYALFSLFSIAGLIWMCAAYTIALNDPMNAQIWSAPLFLKIIALVGNFLAFLLVVVGCLSPSPTNLMALRQLPDKPVHGIIRISRHPVLAGIGVWAVMHILCNGNVASWVFFGSILGLCALGANNIDRKRMALMGETYGSIKKRTSIIPFVAIIEGRTAFAAEEIGAAKMLLAASMFSVFAALHEMLFATRVL